MNAQEALEMLKKCGTNTVEPFESQILEAFESALAELSAIKQRAEEERAALIGGSSIYEVRNDELVAFIDYILKGEEK